MLVTTASHTARPETFFSTPYSSVTSGPIPIVQQEGPVDDYRSGGYHGGTGAVGDGAGRGRRSGQLLRGGLSTVRASLNSAIHGRPSTLDIHNLTHDNTNYSPPLTNTTSNTDTANTTSSLQTPRTGRLPKRRHSYHHRLLPSLQLTTDGHSQTPPPLPSPVTLRGGVHSPRDQGSAVSTPTGAEITATRNNATRKRISRITLDPAAAVAVLPPTSRTGISSAPTTQTTTTPTTRDLQPDEALVTIPRARDSSRGSSQPEPSRLESWVEALQNSVLPPETAPLSTYFGESLPVQTYVPSRSDLLLGQTSDTRSSRSMTRNRAETAGPVMSGSHTATNGNTTSSSSEPPSIRLTPHHDPRAVRPSLNFNAVTRILPNDQAIIKIGRYSERDNNPEVPSNVPSSAPIGFKSKVVSRRHCEFWYHSGQWYIKDVKSSSGTFLNHLRLSPPGVESKPWPVNDGDVVQLGIDFRGGEELIFRCVKIRIEVNRSWQKGLNNFNTSTHKQLQKLTKQGSAPTAKPKDSDTASVNTSECSICLMAISPCQSLFVAPCSHVWHFKCIRPILVGHTYPNFLCPNCRAHADLEADIEDTTPEEWEEQMQEALEASRNEQRTVDQENAASEGASNSIAEDEGNDSGEGNRTPRAVNGVIGGAGATRSLSPSREQQQRQERGAQQGMPSARDDNEMVRSISAPTTTTSITSSSNDSEDLRMLIGMNNLALSQAERVPTGEDGPRIALPPRTPNAVVGSVATSSQNQANMSRPREINSNEPKRSWADLSSAGNGTGATFSTSSSTPQPVSRTTSADSIATASSEGSSRDALIPDTLAVLRGEGPMTPRNDIGPFVLDGSGAA